MQKAPIHGYSGTKKEARVIYTSYGASEDLVDPDGRRFLVNACFWAIGLEKHITPDLAVDIVGAFNPSPYTTGAYFRVGVKPSGLAGWDSAIMPANAKFGGFDNLDKKALSRLQRALRPRPHLVDQIKNNHPDVDLDQIVPRFKEGQRK